MGKKSKKGTEGYLQERGLIPPQGLTIGQQIMLAKNERGQTIRMMVVGTGLNTQTIQEIIHDGKYTISSLMKVVNYLQIDVTIKSDPKKKQVLPSLILEEVE